jgi:hypothetical protein
VSNHSVLSPLLVADVATALTLTAADVYQGRRARKVTNTGNVEVWVERQETSPEDLDVGRASVYRYALHVRRKLNQGQNQTGNALDLAVEAATRTLIDRYDGAGVDLFIGTVTDLAAMQAHEDETDTNPGSVEDEGGPPEVQEGVVIVELLIRR